MYNFLSYTDWPSLPGEFELCLYGSHNLQSELSAFSSKEIKGRRVRIREVKFSDLPGSCHMLFIANSEKDRLEKISTLTSGMAILTVSDFWNDDAQHVSIALGEEEGRLRFSVNKTRAQAGGLVFSSNMLRLARKVR